jgi:release factor glutamine methyltransferase
LACLFLKRQAKVSTAFTTLPTIAQAINEAANRLRESGVSEERRSAALLLGQALGVDRTYLITQANDDVDHRLYQTFLRLIERRAAGEPMQYITGHQEFYGLDFKVTPDVLIPRPETEFLIEQVIKYAQANDSTGQPLIVDAGTGSGCIAVTLALHMKNARLLATDISNAALQVALENAERLGAKDKIEFLQGDLLAPLVGRGLEGRIDVLVSNPPYVALRDAPTLQPEVKDWEPHTALFADEEGLRFYRRLLSEGLQYVRRDGFFMCEIGYTQLDAIQQLINPKLWRLEEVTNDLQGIPRTLTIRRR